MNFSADALYSPCPLCNSDALQTSVDYGVTVDGEWTASVFCTDCGLTMMISRETEEQAENDIVDAWND